MDSHDMDSQALLAWYDAHKRSMPWRDRVSPYRTWVSEIMLQQTQVEVVRGYFERFLAAFPDVHALASSDESAVLNLWAGLGYYSRARNLHKAAKQMVALHGGEPANAVDWAELPGIGRYTLGAIRSIAYGESLPVVDGNVLRVLARVFALNVRRGDPKDDKRVWEVAERILPKGRVGDYNQALMELGATVCTTDGPKCLICPLQQSCQKATEFPLPKAPPKRRRVALHVAWIERDASTFLVTRPKPGLWAGMLALPAVEGERKMDAYLRSLGATRVARGSQLGQCERSLTHRDVALSLFRYEVGGTLRGEWRKDLSAMPAAFQALVKVSR